MQVSKLKKPNWNLKNRNAKSSENERFFGDAKESFRSVEVHRQSCKLNSKQTVYRQQILKQNKTKIENRQINAKN